MLSCRLDLRLTVPSIYHILSEVSPWPYHLALGQCIFIFVYTSVLGRVLYRSNIIPEVYSSQRPSGLSDYNHPGISLIIQALNHSMPDDHEATHSLRAMRKVSILHVSAPRLNPSTHTSFVLLFWGFLLL